MADNPITRSFKLPKWMDERLSKLASDKRWSFGSLMRFIIEKYLDGKL